MWALNVYRFDSFGELFEEWEELSTLPMVVGEYGADSYNALPEVDAYDPTSQVRVEHSCISSSYPPFQHPIEHFQMYIVCMK